MIIYFQHISAQTLTNLHNISTESARRLWTSAARKVVHYSSEASTNLNTNRKRKDSKFQLNSIVTCSQGLSVSQQLNMPCTRRRRQKGKICAPKNSRETENTWSHFPSFHLLHIFGKSSISITKAASKLKTLSRRSWVFYPIKFTRFTFFPWTESFVLLKIFLFFFNVTQSSSSPSSRKKYDLSWSRSENIENENIFLKCHKLFTYHSKNLSRKFEFQTQKVAVDKSFPLS